MTLQSDLRQVFPPLSLSELISKEGSHQEISVGEDVEKREPSCTVGGNVNWYSHYGEQYGGSSKN